MIHVYAFVSDNLALDGLRGLDDAELDVVACGALYAVVSFHEAAPASDQSQVLAHGRVVEAAARRVATLPVRFGSRHPDLAGLVAAVSAQERELADRLRTVRGHVEFAVRAPVPAVPVAPPSEQPDAGPGRSYLQGRLAIERAHAAARDEARQRLETVVRPLTPKASRTTSVEGPRGPEICYLVRADVAETFGATAATLCDGTDLVLVGPWAPYTFASEAHGA